MRILIIGASTRAAAESAARAGFEVTALDAFGDLDQHPSVRGLSLPRDFGRRFTAEAAARAARGLEPDAVVYVSSFENHPRAVRALAAGRALWGNPPAVLQRVRDPILVATSISRRGLATPAVCDRVGFETERSAGLQACDRPSTSSGRGEPVEPRGAEAPRHDTERWLVKPLASGGGRCVRPWLGGAGAVRQGRAGTVPRGCYLQELVDGTPGSVVFVAAGGCGVPLGLSRQLVGEPAFGASGYQYCGNILAAAGDAQFARDEVLAEAACTLARVVVDEFGLIGVNGIDFIARDGVPFVIEVNPRWSASMELIERAYGLSVFGAHAAACAHGALPTFDLARARRGAGALGKAVVYAQRDVTVGDTRRWLADGYVRDVPHPGERIRAGRPVCTVFAAAPDSGGCHAALVRRAARVHAALADWAKRIA